MWPAARSSVPEPEGVPAHVIFFRPPPAAPHSPWSAGRPCAQPAATPGHRGIGPAAGPSRRPCRPPRSHPARPPAGAPPPQARATATQRLPTQQPQHRVGLLARRPPGSRPVVAGLLGLVVHRHDRHLHPCLLGVQDNRERWTWVQHRPSRGRSCRSPECWMGGGIPRNHCRRAPIYFGKTGRSMMALPSGDEDGHACSPEQALSDS
jgi:hypothetical protein